MTPPWQPEDLALVFLTCPREPAYFSATLASALAGDPLTARLREIAVAVDAPDLACVGPLAQDGRVRWVPRSAAESARVADFHLHRRACHNYWRALGLAEGEALPPLRDDVPIAEQFPVETRLTKRIVGGCDRKLLLTRGFQNPAAGHHSMPDECVFPQDGRVLHYKWNAIVLEHLAERIATRGRTGCRWTAECERFLDYWQRHGRIRFADCG